MLNTLLEVKGQRQREYKCLDGCKMQRCLGGGALPYSARLNSGHPEVPLELTALPRRQRLGKRGDKGVENLGC